MKREATAYSLSTEAEQEDPVDSWVQKPFCVPHFLFVGNRLHSASMTFPEFKGQFKQSLVREERGCRDKGEAELCTGVGPASPQGICTAVSLSFSAELKPPPDGRFLTA